MHHDQLYLLKPNFHDHGKICLKVHYVDFPRPRPELGPLLGEENQSCPVLVLGDHPSNLPAHLKIQHAKGHAFVEGARDIAKYLVHIHGTGIPH